MRQRASFLTGLVEHEVLARGRTALVLAGRAMVTRRGQDSPIGQIERRHPGATFVIVPHLGFGADNDKLEARMASWSVPSVATLAGTWLGALDPGGNLGATHRRKRLADLADAYLWLGPRASLSTVAAYPSIYRDPYWNEVRRRHRAVFDRDLNEREAFPTSDCLTLAGLSTG